MRYIWKDYSSKNSILVNSWLDAEAVSMTGLDDGFDAYVNALNEDSANFPGSKNHFKVIFEEDNPIAAVVYGIYQSIVTVAEIIVAPNERGKGKGSQVIKELLQICNDLTDEDIKQFTAVIFPNNIPSQKAFEKAGFHFDHAHEDGDAWYYVYSLK